MKKNNSIDWGRVEQNGAERCEAFQSPFDLFHAVLNQKFPSLEECESERFNPDSSFISHSDFDKALDRFWPKMPKCEREELVALASKDASCYAAYKLIELVNAETDAAKIPDNFQGLLKSYADYQEFMDALQKGVG